MVADAQILGNAKGAAVGMAPRAHLAIYKVCRQNRCFASDILAAVDAAVDDGVDVLSMSLGSDSRPFYEDLVAAGTYRATEKGIFVSCSAGNDGPAPKTVTNTAPWILTVAASNTDRVILATVSLGNGLNFSGESCYQPSNFTQAQLPLIYAGAGPNPKASFCVNGSLDGLDVKGKVVLCDRGGGIERIAMGEVVKAAGGAGMVIANRQSDGQTTIADVHVLPASHIAFFDGLKLKSYINSSQTPTASIVFRGTETGHPAPVMSSFSSRGPAMWIPDLLKPDITGPGLNILAAWPATMPFNILSGTSMSAPHLAGIAALIKSARPSWSPMAIKSAIMTTAGTSGRDGGPILDEHNLPANYFALGSGHVNPVKAINPGLVYDHDFADYTPYLCGLNFTNLNVHWVTGKTVNCSEIKIIAGADLNYPSISVSLPRGEGNVTVWRTVKNVGEAVVDYLVKVQINNVLVVPEPSILRFEKVEEEKLFSLTFRRNVRGSGVAEGRLKLVSSKYEC
ncbi:Subtilisin-like protease [Platanthera guangdongensis]|uniref:Subtilisin-like protease n=1 Tax=Platanthera guangdongensis TaxID=2320717 RepID=A0ABR2LH83_9ASPA